MFGDLTILSPPGGGGGTRRGSSFLFGFSLIPLPSSEIGTNCSGEG